MEQELFRVVGIIGFTEAGSLMKNKPIVVFDRIDKSGNRFWTPLIKLMKRIIIPHFLQLLTSLIRLYQQSIG